MNYKRFTILFVSTLTLVGLLSSCNNSKPVIKPDSPDVDVQPKPDVEEEKDYNCFFTSYYNGKELYDSAVSISTTKESENLKGVQFNIYKRRKNVFTYTFDDVNITPSEPFIFKNPAFSKDDAISNFQSYTLPEDKIYNICYYELVKPTGQVIDCLGNKGFDFELAVNQTLVRLKEFYKPSPIFRFLNFIRKVNTDEFIIEPNITLDELLTGPRIDETRYGNMNYSDGGKPTGGFCKVSLAKGGLGDGDTTQFDWPHNSGIPNGYKHRVRYLLVNTPELDHTSQGSPITEQPWGKAAQKFNNDKLRHASIIVQSDMGGSLQDTYGRTLGYVWYTNKENPDILDYRLLNFELVLEGLAMSDIRDESNLNMRWNGITYSSYVRYGYELAREQGKKIHGEVDPDFDYGN